MVDAAEKGREHGIAVDLTTLNNGFFWDVEIMLREPALHLQTSICKSR
jgi:hypothetical protein